jgi:signal transduction histidine kinase
MDSPAMKRTQPSPDTLRLLETRVTELERDKAALESFAAVAAHELMQPLVMTEAYVEMVNDRLDEREHSSSRRDLEALARGARRLRLLLETLLHDARTPGAQLRRRWVDLNVVVDDTLVLLATEIEERHAYVQVDPLPRIRGEEELLGAVFSNLLINALKYSPRESVQIRVGAQEEREEWRFWVDSAGPAIPPDERGRIFEPWHRGRDERRARGAGLGLAICRRIVERHGGTIGVTTANGSGNRFFFTLPAG